MREGVRELSEFIWAVCFDDEDGVATYAIESCETESEACKRAQKRNQDEGCEDYYFAAELEPDALDAHDRWRMDHHGTAIRII